MLRVLPALEVVQVPTQPDSTLTVDTLADRIAIFNAGQPGAVIIDPATGVGVAAYEPSAFQRWLTNLHRSQFLDDAGRRPATSDDYRQWSEVGGKRLAHRMDPARSDPVKDTPASVTVLAGTRMQADAWVTAFMVSGEQNRLMWSRKAGVAAVFAYRDGDDARQTRTGWPNRSW